MAKKLAIALAAVAAAILGYAATKPDSFRVQRSASINAAPEKIAADISDFHGWSDWSTWEKMDPGMKRTYSGAASGKGAIYEWDGNKDIGKGRMEILEATPSKVTIMLDFIKPMAGHSIAEFTLVSKGDSTEVTWAMHGPQPYIGKLISVFCNMDKMIGKEFEAGLANLKSIAEKR